MLFFSALPIVVSLYGMAIPGVSAVNDAGAFTVWNGTGCDDATSTRKQFQPIPSNVCDCLPGTSFKLDFLLGPRENPRNPQCLIRLYSGKNCQGNVVTYSPPDYDQCKDITTRLSYRIENC